MIELKKHVVFPGQFIITSVPTLISTVLGSCVSICLWDKEKKIGAMNHYLLPGKPEDEIDNMNRGLTSIRMLIRSLINRNVNLHNLEAKVFGGCNSLYINNDYFKVGERNVEVAFELLKQFNITLKAQHVGGSVGRKIVFNTETGKVRMQLLSKTTAEINEEINKGFGY
ncbi:MAG TPA: chemotaxis protein CheD [Cyclobacteriaceae bacterium]